MALLHLREVVVDTGEETGLSETEEPTTGQESSLVLDETHDGHDGTPGDDDGGEKDTGRVAFEKNVGDGLGTCVRDEEDGQGIVVVASDHADAGLQVGCLCIANVGAVQERQEIQEREPRD